MDRNPEVDESKKVEPIFAPPRREEPKRVLALYMEPGKLSSFLSPRNESLLSCQMILRYAYTQSEALMEIAQPAGIGRQGLGIRKLEEEALRLEPL